MCVKAATLAKLCLQTSKLPRNWSVMNRSAGSVCGTELRFTARYAKAKFRRRTSHEPNRMQMRKILCYLSLRYDLAHVKVHLTPNYFFRSNKTLHLFEKHCAFLPPFKPNRDFFQVVKVTKSGHHLSHDRASKGYGSIPCLASQTSLHACLQRLNTMQISL